MIKRTLLLPIALLICFSIVASINIIKNNSTFKDTIITQEKPKNNYENLWQKADSLEKKGLIKSANETVQNIYAFAKKENNDAQLVKAIIYKMKFESVLMEKSDEKNISDITKEIKESKGPTKYLLQSLLAESYLRYFQKNRYKFYNRTALTNYKNQDISTWDLQKINNEILTQYSNSLKNTDETKKLKINYYDAIIDSGTPESKRLRPSLFDFLAYRALDYFESSETWISQPIEKFELNSPDYFKPLSDFIKIKFEPKDSLTQNTLALKTLQNLLEFHKDDISPEALVDADIRRIRFVFKNSTLYNKDSLYIQSLISIQETYSKFASSTEAAYEIALYYHQQASKYIPTDNDDNKWENNKAHDICNTAIEKFPNSFGGKKCNYLLSQILEKEINFKIEKVNTPENPFRSLVSYKNIDNIYLKIVLIKETHGKRRGPFGEQLLKKYLELPLVKEWKISLPADRDFNKHSVEILIPKLNNGHYALLISDNKEFNYTNHIIAFDDFWISNLSYIIKAQKTESAEVYILNRETGNPIKNATVTLWHEKYNPASREYDFIKGNTSTSDFNGHLVIKKSAEQSSYYLELQDSNDYLFSDYSVYLYKQYNAKIIPRTKTFFYSDRAIYRPGQTVYFKGIMLETDGENNNILPETPSNVTFYDVNGQKTSELSLISNSYGTFSGSFVIPTGTLTGQMRISDRNGNHYITVEEYKRPKFEVEFTPLEGIYRLNDAIKVKGLAKSYAGAQIDGATVTYRIVRNARFPNWHWHRTIPSSQTQEIGNGIIKTNEKGEFTIVFKAIPDAKIKMENKPIFGYTIFADVTDINGETRSSSTIVNIGYHSTLISFKLPENSNINEIKPIAVSVTNLNGKPIETIINATVHKIKQPDKITRNRLWETPDKFLLAEDEYVKNFPNDIYKNEHHENIWIREKKVFEASINTAKQNALEFNDASKWGEGIYSISIENTDIYGQKTNTTSYFSLYNTSSKNALKNELFNLIKVKNSGEPGEKAEFILSSKVNLRILYEIEHKGKIIYKEFITINNEKKKIELPILEEYRGNFAVHFTSVSHGRDFKFSEIITVPYSNKKLDITFETFRNKLLPGEKEQWKIKITGNKGEKVSAEMMASLYDASLDAFKKSNWTFDIYKKYYATQNWTTGPTFGIINSDIFGIGLNKRPEFPTLRYDRLNWFGYENFYYYGGGQNRSARGIKSEAMAMAENTEAKPEDDAITDLASTTNEASSKEISIANADNEIVKQELSNLIPRKNFNETAFFFPQLETNEKGEVIINFTIPEALTRWKMLGLAHTQDLKIGLIENELITQKKLMVMPNLPRFFREGDKINIVAKINNLSEDNLSGNAQLQLFDAISMKPLNEILKSNSSIISFEANSGLSTTVSWELEIPKNIDAITYRITAKANNHTDGEEATIPVLKNRMLVTESMPITIRGNQNKTFTLSKLKESSKSTTLSNHRLTFEYTSNPAWYAIQALPYLIEYPYACSEQIFNRYYANSLASHIANTTPKIKSVFDRWKDASGKDKNALLSNLEKNKELKSVLLEETPWVLDAQNESEQKKRIALLFDLNKMSNEKENALNQLSNMQLSNGGFPWFAGMPDDRYITQYIIGGIGHLKKLNVDNFKEDKKTNALITKAILFLDKRLKEDYDYLLNHKTDLNKNNLTAIQIHYFYSRSFFPEIALDKLSQVAYNYYKDQMKKFWLQNSIYMQGMIALSIHRTEKSEIPNAIISSLKEKSILHNELGMYWKEIDNGYHWHQASIESQALLIEAFHDISLDNKSVEEMQIWLLKQKQTQNWKSTKATAEACYALLLQGKEWLSTEVDSEIKIGNSNVSDSQKNDTDKEFEAGSGYFKNTWGAEEIKPEMATVIINKKDKGISWGALYWQYFEQLDKITPAETPLKITKKLYKEIITDRGPQLKEINEGDKVKIGDKIIVRMIINVDRGMDYIHLKDMRASGFEPINVLSNYKYRDGLGYYESTRDASTNFFFSHLSKGTYVFEYPLRASFKGVFSNGITSMQCMYAPEFSSHSDGIRVEIE